MDEKKSPNDHYLIPHLTLFSKITRAELGAEGQRYETNSPTHRQNSATKVIRIQVFLERIMIYKAIKTSN